MGVNVHEHNASVCMWVASWLTLKMWNPGYAGMLCGKVRQLVVL